MTVIQFSDYANGDNAQENGDDVTTETLFNEIFEQCIRDPQIDRDELSIEIASEITLALLGITTVQGLRFNEHPESIYLFMLISRVVSDLVRMLDGEANIEKEPLFKMAKNAFKNTDLEETKVIYMDFLVRAAPTRM